jgi:CO/xanthine dehydrogenase FAD-binding subunit
VWAIARADVPVLLVSSLAEAIEALDGRPGATVLAGGTDVMVEVGAGHRSLGTVVSLRGVPELRRWSLDATGRWLTIGAGVTYTDLLGPEIRRLAPALSDASRTVGSPQIRNAGTIGGNLGTCSPAGDTLPVLAALDAVVGVSGPSGDREVPFGDFMTGPKRTALGPADLIVWVRIPVVDGYQGYAKVGVRNAMVISAAGACLVVDNAARSVRLALGSVGPVMLRAREAEAWAQHNIDWDRGRLRASASVREFGELAAAAARPIDDHRSTAAYRRHAIAVLAGRLLERAAA